MCVCVYTYIIVHISLRLSIAISKEFSCPKHLAKFP